MLEVKVVTRSGKTLTDALFVDGISVNSIQDAIHKKFPKYYPTRQRLTFDNKVLKPTDKLAELGIMNGTTIEFKDLGPQVGWRTVFIVEYLGPLLIHPIFYYFPQFFYSSVGFQHSKTQHLALLLAVFHFAKREFETLYIHRFSLPTMPLRNIFKNSFHYWILSGFNLAYWIYSPNNTYENSSHVFWISLFMFAQISNLITHITLRNLRPEGSTVRKIPFGYGFNLVSCPNYFFEILAWAAFTGLTRSWAALFFLSVSSLQMYVWAVKKHKSYKKEFGDKYPRNRKVIIPFLV